MRHIGAQPIHFQPAAQLRHGPEHETVPEGLDDVGVLGHVPGQLQEEAIHTRVVVRDDHEREVGGIVHECDEGTVFLHVDHVTGGGIQSHTGGHFVSV